MDMRDKRLINRMAPAAQEEYLKTLHKEIENADGKFDELTVEHEPIALVQKIAARHRSVPVAAMSHDPDDTDED